MCSKLKKFGTPGVETPGVPNPLGPHPYPNPRGRSKERVYDLIRDSYREDLPRPANPPNAGLNPPPGFSQLNLNRGKSLWSGSSY